MGLYLGGYFFLFANVGTSINKKKPQLKTTEAFK